MDEKYQSEFVEILNPQQMPKIQLKKIVSAPAPTTTRLKFRYKVVEKPKFSYLSMSAGIAILLIFIILLASSYVGKVNNLESISAAEQQQCRLDYEKNKCEKGLKATVQYCEQKRRCFEEQANRYYQSKIKTTFIIGEVIRDFTEGAGLYVCIGFLAVVWIFVQRNPPRQITREYQQYFQ